MYDAENNVIKKDFYGSTIQEFIRSQCGSRMRTRSQMQKIPIDNLILSYKLIECNEHSFEIAQPDLDPCENSLQQEPMECDDGHDAKPFATSSPNGSLYSQYIMVKFHNLDDPSNVTELQFGRTDQMKTICNLFRNECDKNMEFFDHNEPLDFDSLDYPLEKFLCEDDTTFDLYFQYLDEDICNNLVAISSPSKNTSIPAAAMSSISVRYTNRSNPNDSIEIFSKRSEPMDKMLNDFAKKIGENVNNLIFFEGEADSPFEPTSTPLERFLHLDQEFLDIQYKSERSTEIWQEVRSKKGAKKELTIRFIDRRNLSSEMDLSFSEDANMMFVIDQIVEVMDFNKPKYHFYGSNGKSLNIYCETAAVIFNFAFCFGFGFRRQRDNSRSMG